jgi:hypothetical protein
MRKEETEVRKEKRCTDDWEWKPGAHVAMSLTSSFLFSLFS